MKNPDRATVSRLEDLPNVGKATAGDLRRIGIDQPESLIGEEPFAMYEKLCAVSGQRHDPCMIDIFMSVVHFMEGGEALPWWSFTEMRKNTINQTITPHPNTDPAPQETDPLVSVSTL